MRKEWLLSIGVAAVSIFVALAGVRYFAPQLLGIPIDLQAVQVSEEVPPFFENVFRTEDYQSKEFIIKDPYVRVRAKPRLFRTLETGPHDVLGFRNHAIPNIADIVVIGDSQTYGLNTLLEANWPNQMRTTLRPRQIVYSMATGGWGAVQYLDMVAKSSAFQPNIILVAFYSGNDPLETFSLVYNSPNDKWSAYKVDQDTAVNDRPENVGFPSPTEKNWQVKFKNGADIVFTPALRLMSNDTGYAVVRESWAIMAKIVEKMADIAQSIQARLVVTVIPTKELVYLERIKRENIPLDPVYQRLIVFERKNIDDFLTHATATNKTVAIDVIPGLQSAALNSSLLYPADANGHPMDLGYRVIGNLLADGVSALLQDPQPKLRTIKTADGHPDWYFLSKGNRLFLFSSRDLVTSNGWDLSTAENIDFREFSKPIAGLIDTVDKTIYGPD